MTKKLHVPAGIPAKFNDWRAPKRGTLNPEDMTNDVWVWLVETKAWPHLAHQAAGTGEQHFPGWCFDRFGQSETCLSDGTIVYIGGEHEDGYDPDFYIYNDVIVRHPDGEITIYGYPTKVFPPTDFHSATLIEGAIYILGGLRYPNDRDETDTYLYRLDLRDFSIQRLPTRGTRPASLHNHDAKLSGHNKILCTGGQVTHSPTSRLVENLTTWELSLETNIWAALESKPFTRWLLTRVDKGYNELWRISQVVRATLSKRNNRFTDQYRVQFEERGHVIDTDLYFARFDLPIPHRMLERDPDRDDYRTHRLLVDDVVICIKEGSFDVTITVEGTLSEDKLDVLKRHGIDTYSKLEGVPYKCIPL